MVGFPQDTEDTLRDTVRAIEASNSDMVCYSIFTPYPGTEAFAYCKSQGLVDDSFDVALYNHLSPENHFCAHIPRARFRALVAGLERSCARLNRRNRFKRIFSRRTLERLHEEGMGGGVKRLKAFIRWSG